MKTSDAVFIVGSGRSGTTWLHMMLGSNERIATGQESQLFHKYLRGLYEQWQRELSYPESDKLRKHGISSYISEEQFIEYVRDFATSIFDNVLTAKPGATLFLEKSPNNSFNVDLICKCFPDARFIHVLRDCRDVVASMLAAKKGWGGRWAPRSAHDAAAEWVSAVTESMRLAEIAEKYIEVRYETLLSEGCAELRRVFEFLDLECSESEAEDVYQRFAFDKLKKNEYSRDVFLNPGVAKASGTRDLPEPKGFFRKGIAGGWKTSLSDAQVEEIYWAAGELMHELGYIDSPSRPARMPGSVRRQQLLAKTKQKVSALGAKLLS